MHILLFRLHTVNHYLLMLGTHGLKIVRKWSVWQLPDDFRPMCTTPCPNRSWFHEQLLWNEHAEKPAAVRYLIQ